MHLQYVLCGTAALWLFCFPSFAQDPRTAADLVRTALENNREYLAARERTNEAEALIRQAGLRPVPTVEFDAANGAILGSHREAEYSAAYYFTLETDGKRAKRVAVAEKGRQLAEAELREMERQIAFEVRKRFLDAAEQQLKLASVRALIPVLDDQYQLAVQRVGLGDAAPLEQQLLLSEKNRIEAQQAWMSATAEAALVELKAATGQPAGDTLEIDPELTLAGRDLTLATLQELALRQRPDLVILKLLEEQGVAQTELTRAEARADITVSGRYTHSRSAFDQFGLSDSGAPVPLTDADNILSVGISIPLSKRSRGQAAADASQSREIQQRLRSEHFSQSIPLEVEAAHRRLTGALRAMQILREGVLVPSQNTLTVIREAYRLGELRLFDVLNEQRRLVEPQAEAARALIELEHAVGGNLP